MSDLSHAPAALNTALQLIFTGFEPFGAHPTNPSWDAAQAAAAAVDELARAELRARCECLPVTYHNAQAYARRILEPGQPCLLIHIGLAERRTTIGLEAIARNVCGAALDNAGECGPGLKAAGILVADGPSTTSSTLDLAALLDMLRHQPAGHGLPSWEISHDCGDYVCNATYYHSIQATRGHPGAHALFVHIPPVQSHIAADIGRVLAAGIIATI